MVIDNRTMVSLSHCKLVGSKLQTDTANHQSIVPTGVVNHLCVAMGIPL